MMHFNPVEYGFYPDAKLNIVLGPDGLRVKDCPNNPEVDIINPGVYVWAVNDGQGLVPKYFGLYGKSARAASLRKRFLQHQGGLRASTRVPPRPPTPHWRDCLVPGLLAELGQHPTVDIYFGHFSITAIDSLETLLIEQFDTPWNKAKKRKTAV